MITSTEGPRLHRPKRCRTGQSANEIAQIGGPIEALDYAVNIELTLPIIL